MAKILIDSEKLNALFESDWKWADIQPAFITLVDKEGIILLNNATNGQVMELLFPNDSMIEIIKNRIASNWWDSLYKVHKNEKD